MNYIKNLILRAKKNELYAKKRLAFRQSFRHRSKKKSLSF